MQTFPSALDRVLWWGDELFLDAAGDGTGGAFLSVSAHLLDVR